MTIIILIAALAALFAFERTMDSIRLNLLQAASDATRFTLIILRLQSGCPRFDDLGEEFFQELPYIKGFGPERLCWPAILEQEFYAELAIGKAFKDAGWVDCGWESECEQSENSQS